MTAPNISAEELGNLQDIYTRLMCGMKADAKPRCEERPFHIFLMGNGFLVIFLLAMFGNIINLVIYNSDQIRFFLAIRMLCMRLLMNTFTMLFMLPHALRTCLLWDINTPLDQWFWKLYPYQAYGVNVFGFCAMWLTVLMTGECYLHVFFPSHSKSLCTKKNLCRSYKIMFAFSLLLALTYLLNRTASVEQDECLKYYIKIEASTDALVVLVERIHTLAHVLFASVIPMAALLFMTSSIVYRLYFKHSEFNNSTHFTSEKRSVTRITLITTSLQLISELPAIPVFLYAAISGPRVINEDLTCIWHTIGTFLGLCNMSLSFYMYIAMSQKFRQMLKSRFCEILSSWAPSCWKPLNYSNNGLNEPLRFKNKNGPQSCDTVADSLLMTDKSSQDTIL